jgi:hypothetical protein
MSDKYRRPKYIGIKKAGANDRLSRSAHFFRVKFGEHLGWLMMLRVEVNGGNEVVVDPYG